MNITHLTLKNFRCFEEARLTFSEPFTLLLGDNGAGKTALVEALHIAAGAFLLGIKPLRAPGILPSDLRERIVPDSLGNVVEPPERRVFGPAIITAEGTLQRRPARWQRVRNANGGGVRGSAAELTDLVTELAQARTDDKRPDMPLLAYYSAKRVAQQRRDPVERPLPPSRWERGYEGALSGVPNQSAAIRWIRSTTFSELQQGLTSPLLASMLDRVGNVLEGYQRVYYSVQLEELVAVDEQGRQRRAHILSEGYWTMLMMILDMAYRCVILNPHLGRDVLSKTPGIVLIDELDLHLHPRWQQRIVNDLTAAFPNVQFIATTHSPLIGASLPSSCLYHLEVGEDGWGIAHQYHEKTMGLSSDQMLTGSYFDLMNDRPIQAQSELEALAQRVGQGDTDAALAFLKRLNNGMEGADTE